MTPHSMTGYAAVRKLDGDREIAISVKSLNHRGLDLHFRMAPELDPFENALRNAVKAPHPARLFADPSPGGGPDAVAPVTVNQKFVDAYIAAYRRVAAQHGFPGEPDLNAAFRISGVFETADQEPDPELERLLVEALDEALELLTSSASAKAARPRRHAGPQRDRARMHARDGGPPFTRGAGVSSPAEREAGRTAGQLRHRPPAPGPGGRGAGGPLRHQRGADPPQGSRDTIGRPAGQGREIGKKLDFMLQEMHRETNTILSKIHRRGELGLKIAELALTVKAEVEKIREQGLNLE